MLYKAAMLGHQEARDFFPRGLRQPTGSFRFSADALLLAAFAARLAGVWVGGRNAGLAAEGRDAELPGARAGDPPPGGPARRSLLDLGCGCGVVGLGFMLLRPEFTALGLDLQPELILAARENAARLGFAHRYRALELDLRQLPDAGQLAEIAGLHRPGSFTLATANPPYRKPGSGRLPASQARRLALFGDSETLSAFARAAALALAPGGLFCLIFTLDRENELRKILLEQGFAPARRLEISGKEGLPPEWLLLAAVRQGEAEAALAFASTIKPETGLTAASMAKPVAESAVMPAANLPERLYLRCGQNGRTGGLSGGGELTPEALLFCPFLACNAK